MKKNLFLILFIAVATSLSAQWKPAGDKIKTKWADEIDVNNVLPEYPRPMMERTAWKNLNGLWDYAILPAGAAEPTAFDGKILVPFAVESSLSGVQKTLGKENELWYKQTFTVPANWKGKDVLLHFGGVDWRTEIYVNDIKIGTHEGGYTPFSFNITPYLTSGNQKLVVKVWDPTTDGYQPVGKQNKRPEGIWYTPVSGIWQTVWLEPVTKKHIAHIKAIPCIDSNRLTVDVCTENTAAGDIVEVIVKDGSSVVAKAKGAACQQLALNIANPKLWSPESPFLYDMEVNLYSGGKLQDKVKSYTAMRKISAKRDANGIMRMQLNNKDYFQLGPLDQGWWPDGLYTAPTDEALLYDIQKTKDMGFNMIRKHVKVEPARWYTHCDRVGILVWQDMPNGDKSPQWQQYKYFDGTEIKRSPASEADYRAEWKGIMDYLMSHPSIVVWVPFNEAWGQFKTEEITEWTQAYDPSRLVNSASGGNHYKTGDILDIHRYPKPELPFYDAERVTVLGEYGGIGFPMQGHLWQTDRNWGYVQFKNKKEVTDEYVKFAEELKKLAKVGYSAGVYTQTTDVEGEVNGLITYDRKEIKVEEGRIAKINKEVCDVLK
ncbi:glycoside hydrolase family 2 protein [Dysgonomonas sp. 25]|uniref:glycoside hydrolase family 2 protein n=1 Tax=Dysgonomonas sp. 25 TaxID=2302933 RepID=UPI0013D19FD7|nr:sugar-binding domain-containing protein [Dysgonomonas sp. 25]NDV69902.1 beta-galactosidase [Dysgonomonas sp. 25]